MRGWQGFCLVAGLLMGMAEDGGAQAAPRMAKGAHPSFEVAAIRLSDPDSHKQGIDADGHRMMLQGETVTSMVMFAYGVHKKQIADGPGWMSNDKYDVDGVADVDGEPDLKQMQEMLQKLLAERFGLKFHRDNREMTYFAITVAKGGAKMAKAEDAEATPDQSGNGSPKQMNMKFTSNSMSDFALGMQYFLDKPAVNETGLEGRYDFSLKWMPDELGTSEENGPPGMFTAIQEQLGLKLEAKKGMVEVLVVDSLGRPTGN
jgi:uncharacterized protein (TIGR03435 family)